MQNEKFIRVRYLRCLEKFATNVIKALKRDDFDAQIFSAMVEKNELLRSANALEKFKKAREYKRNKNDKNFDD